MSMLDGEMFDPGDVRSILVELEATLEHETEQEKIDLLMRTLIVIRNQQRLIDDLTPKPLNHFELKRRLSSRSGSR